MAQSFSYDAGRENEVESEGAYSPVETAGSQEVAGYLADLISELESMARKSGLDLLAYLLSMAHSEAQTNARAAQDRGP